MKNSHIRLALLACISFLASVPAHAAEMLHTFAVHTHVIATNYMTAVGFMLYDNEPEKITATQIKALADKQSELLETTKELKSFMTKANEEIDNSKSLSAETKSAIEKLTGQATVLTEKCLELEQKMSAKKDNPNEVTETLGAQFIKSADWDAMQKKRGGSARMEIKAAIVNASGASQPLVQADRVQGIITNPNRIFTIRDLLPVGQTGSNMVEYTRENVFTNNAGPQYASPAFENVTKPESGITFTLESEAVRTLAHWIPVSKQVLDDSPMLRSFIEGRLMYGLKLEEEDQLLNGDGTGSNLSGLLDAGNFVAYNRGQTGDTNIDTLRRAITQGWLSEYMMDTIVINPADWEEIELTKTSEGAYVWSNPQLAGSPQLWGKRVVATNSMPQGDFLVGSMAMGAQIWDRQQSAVLASTENGDNFVKNMVTLLAEERLALTVYRPAAFVSGSF
jgi:HK97 family phage major capsid protein